jgi:hypothetical protein
MDCDVAVLYVPLRLSRSRPGGTAQAHRRGEIERDGSFAIGVDRSYRPLRGFLPRKTTPPDFLHEGQAAAAPAAFIKESRMKFINANKLHRKSGHLSISIRPQ